MAHYFEINGGKKLSGSVEIRGSKNAAIAVMVAALINKGKTTLHNVSVIEEVARLIEVMESIGVRVTRNHRTLIIEPPKKLALEKIHIESAKKTRIILLFLGALARQFKSYAIPQSGGCRLGSRTIRPHLFALEKFGIDVVSTRDTFEVNAKNFHSANRVILYEAGDTVTENALLAAAQTEGETQIRFATGNYMVQDFCFFLELLGVKIDGIGTSSLTVQGVDEIHRDVEYTIGEDPIEAMFFIATAITTKSEFTITRAPIEFLELELLKLEKMGQRFDISPEYTSENGRTRLVDITLYPSKLKAPKDKIHALPYPGINFDNLPFFAPIVATAQGETLIHDWAFENRMIYLADLPRLGVNLRLLDPHRVEITGPTKFVANMIVCPPALRPAACIIPVMLAAKGVSRLYNVYPIERGYEDIVERLQDLGADIKKKDEACMG